MSLAHVHVIIVLFFWCWASHPRLSFRFGCLPPISAVTAVWGERYVGPCASHGVAARDATRAASADLHGANDLPLIAPLFGVGGFW